MDGTRRRSAPSPPFVLEDKLAPPTVRVAVLPRKRLIERMTTAVESRVTVLHAPAGSGKTVLLATWWSAGGSGHRVWLSLDDSDNAPGVFWAYLVEALRRDATGPTLQLLADLDVPDSVDEGFVDRFVATVARVPADVTIVLDDVHRLRDPRVLGGLYRLLRHAPPRLHMVLSGRRPPDLPLSKLRVAGNLADIGYRDLACTAEEAAALLRLLGVELDESGVKQVQRSTEGWLAGLRLAALWSRSESAVPPDFSLFSGGTQVVSSYFEDEIFGLWDPSVRQFMLQTCLVDTICGELADSLTDRQDGARTLEELVRLHGWVTTTDSEGVWFRYNPLMREFLRTQLLRERPGEIRSLHRRAAHWYARHNLVLPALRSAADAADWSFMTRLLLGSSRRLRAADPAEVDTLLARLPHSFVQADGALALVYADAKLRRRDPEGAEPYLRIAENARSPADGRSIREQLRRAELHLRQAALRGPVPQADLEQAGALLARAASDPEGHAQPALAPLAFQIGIGHLSNANTVAAREAIGLAINYEHDPSSELRTLALDWHWFLNVVNGKLSSAAPAHLVPALDTLGHAIAECERDRLDSALALVHPESLSTADETGFSAIATGRLLKAWVRALRGEFDDAEAELRLVRAIDPASAHISHYADLVDSALALRRGDVSGSRRTLTTALADPPVPDLAVDGVALGRLCLAEHQPEAALDAVRTCLDGSAANLRLVDLVAAQLVAASAQRILGRAAKANAALEHALELATPEGLVQVFLTSGRIVQSMLTVAIQPNGPYSSTRAVLLHHFERQANATESHSADQPALTPSEHHVLRYLPSHLTNDEIAANLFLSVNTVKSHLRTLYRKLGVSNRRSAIAKGRQFGLLD